MPNFPTEKNINPKTQCPPTLMPKAEPKPKNKPKPAMFDLARECRYNLNSIGYFIHLQRKITYRYLTLIPSTRKRI
uniref:Uncharacterized protein n=1 Tax=Romanomermis culicivorax TaxID=13658 RepID=A0A915JNJ0_ROMCU